MIPMVSRTLESSSITRTVSIGVLPKVYPNYRGSSVRKIGAKPVFTRCLQVGNERCYYASTVAQVPAQNSRPASPPLPEDTSDSMAWPVLLMARELDLGGSERQMTVIAKALDRTRFEPYVGCFRPAGLRGAELRAAQVPIV